VAGSRVRVWINDTAAFDFTDDKPFPAGSAPITYGGFQISWYLETLGWVDNVVVTDLR